MADKRLLTLGRGALQELKDLKKIIRKEIFAILGNAKHDNSGIGRTVRHGKTTSYEYPYPQSGNTFEVLFGDPVFDDENGPGDLELEFEEYLEKNWVRLCHSINDRYYPEDTKVNVVRIYKRWYIIDGGVCDFVRFKSVTETPIPSDECWHDGIEDGEPMMYLEVEVESTPCGCGTVPEQDEYDIIKVYDTTKCKLFDEIDYMDKKGYAKYMIPLKEECPDEYEGAKCKWEIVDICCGDVMTPLGTNLKYADGDEYSEGDYCIELERVLVPVCPIPTTPSELCGDGPCPEADCPESYDEYSDYTDPQQ